MELTGENYCRDYFRFRGLKGERLNNIIKSVCEFTELGDFFHEPIRTYSSGMKAKLLFGVATAIPAKIILVDEFLVVGDEYFQGKAWNRLRSFLSAGATGIIVSHDWTSLMKLCKRTVVLSKQGIDYIGETYKAVQKYLNIPFIESDEITFLNKKEMTENIAFATSGKPLIYKFQVKKHKKCVENRFSVAFSIERHIEGIGWSLAMTGSKNIEIDKPKTNNISLVIQDFYLAPGEYLLCLFLSSPLVEGQKTVDKGYEALTWLNGNAIKLKVEGENKTKQLIKKELKWQINYL